MKETGKAKSGSDKPIFFLTLVAFLSILLMPELAGDGMRSGLLLSARAVIPSVGGRAVWGGPTHLDGGAEGSRYF